MTEPRTEGFQFEGTLCGEECFGVPTRINRGHPYVVDEECAKESVVPLLLAAVASEFSYPALWGNMMIDHRRFLHLLPEDFAEKYSDQRDEYRTPLALRIYCRNELEKETAGLKEQCGAFVGEKVSASAQPGDNNIKWVKCRICSTRCCNKCGAIVVSRERWRTVLHRCAAPTDDGMSAFDGLIQGVHYQICPGCGMKVELAEACNALRCLGRHCRTDFCAICGLRAEHDSDHWQAGKPCPRWNKPTDANAGFDPVPVEPRRTAEWLAAEELMNTEMRDWRLRPYCKLLFNFQLESHLEAYLREVGVDAGLTHARGTVEELYSRLEDKESLTLLRHLLPVHQDTLQVLPAHRGVGRYLTKDHLRRLQVTYVGKYFSILALWETIGEHFMLDYPRFVDTLQRTIDGLEWTVIDIREELEGTDDEAAGLNDMNQPVMPDVEDRPDLWADSYEAYKGLEEARLSMIEMGIVRPPRLGAAIDMFWLQYSNLQIPREFREATSTGERYRLMINFMAGDEEIEQRRNEMGTDRWPEEMRLPSTELWEPTMEGYTEIAKEFKKLVPLAVLVDYLRGWLD